MKLLREYIRELLKEVAKGPSDLPEGWILAAYNDGNPREYVLKDNERNEVARLHVEQKECDDVWVVTSSRSWKKGWGPMMYDVAMEDAGGNGIMPDRDQVSPEASQIWDYYLNNRSDVSAIYMGDLGIDTDYCPEYGDQYDSEPDPLDYIYKKNSTNVIQSLMDRDVWRE